MRLIDADALAKELMHEGLGYQYNRVINAPTVDAVPVRHGKWLYIRTDDDGNGVYECSVCHMGETHSPIVVVRYCWNCGAKMDAEKEDVYVTLHHDDINFKDEESEKVFYSALEREEE